MAGVLSVGFEPKVIYTTKVNLIKPYVKRKLNNFNLSKAKEICDRLCESVDYVFCIRIGYVFEANLFGQFY